MKISKIHRGTNQLFGAKHLNLVYNQEGLTDFIGQPFSYANVIEQIKLKQHSFDAEKRNLLVKALKEQYAKIDSNSVSSQINLLADENTFTVTTGHQLSLFTGPLYFVLKILETIKLSRELKEKYSDYNFVPVFWMASEDHDFEEIQSVKIFNKDVKWNADKAGAVGRFKLDGFDEVKKEFLDFFSNHPESEIIDLFVNYSGDDLADATRNLVHNLFKEFGLLIIDGDDNILKSQMIDTFISEVENEFSYKAVTETNAKLEKAGGKIQVHAREINVFHLGENSRNRIIKTDSGNYDLGDGIELPFSELTEKIKSSPASFSPNVILRPLYQETILPNLVYTGGGGEISYWLQLKGVFDAANVPFPLVKVRNSIFWIDKNTQAKIEKLNFSLEDFLGDIDGLKKTFVLENSNEELDFSSLDTAAENLNEIIKEKTFGVDEKMMGFAEAEITRLNKQLDGIKAKLIKREKSKLEQDMKAIDFVREKLFPNGILQERTVNFFNLSPNGNFSENIHFLYEALDPQEKDVIVLTETE